MKHLPESKKWRAAWWLVWLVFLVRALTVHSWKQPAAWFRYNSEFGLLPYLIMVAPAVISGALRGLVLPKAQGCRATFALFFVGLTFAEMTAFIPSFLEIPFRDLTFLGSLGVMVSYAPIRSGAALPPKL